MLGTELVKIIRKLTNMMKSGFVKRMEEYGTLRVKILVAQAADWGNGTVKKWASEIGFIRYLTLIYMNTPSGFGC
ncbi:MAG: hypothetical protein ACFFDN_17270 [Candidatus Hodarchaeota archaeon]